MKKKWITPTVFVIAVVFLQLGACARFLESRNSVTSPTTVTPTSQAMAPSQSASQALAERDFSAALEPCQPKWVDRATSQDLPPQNWKLADRPIGLGGLPKAQQLQLGGYVAPNSKYVDIGWMFLTTERFKKEFGRWPHSGLEIVLWLQSNTPSVAGEDLSRLSPEAMPPWFFKFVNPQTGKLYKSFDGSVLEPGGVKFRRLVDVEDCKQAFDGRTGWELFNSPRCVGGYEISVSDTDPSRVLDTAITLNNMDLETEENPVMPTKPEEDHLHPHTH